MTDEIAAAITNAMAAGKPIDNDIPGSLLSALDRQRVTTDLGDADALTDLVMRAIGLDTE